MARKLDYRWHLRQVMAERGMFATTDLIDPLAARGIRLSSRWLVSNGCLWGWRDRFGRRLAG